MIVNSVFDELTEKAKNNPRLRLAYDLRNSPADKSQRMLNAIEPGTEVPIHRHLNSSETVMCVRGHFEELLYDEKGMLIEKIDMQPGGVLVNIPQGQWHSLRSLETGTILFECKDGAYEPLKEEEVWRD